MTEPTVIEAPDHGIGLKQTEGIPALPAKEIPLTTFHSFLNLPTELRLQIWEEACFHYAATRRGLHYIDLESIGGNEISGEVTTEMAATEMKALDPDFKTSLNDRGVVGRANRSAYMRDAGLWEACPESREVISRHFKLNVWGDIQDKDLDLLDLDECLSKACQPYPWKPLHERLKDCDRVDRSNHKPEPFLPTCLLSRHQNHAERFMVMPTRDLFCIKSLGRGDSPATIQAPRLHVPCPNGQEIVILYSLNLVFEFHTSWLRDFPESWNELTEEESPRGLFATWVNTGKDSRGNAPCIYLLNKAARWEPHWGMKDEIVFHDCDNAYVEVHNAYSGSRAAISAQASAMLWFVWRVSELRTIAFCEDCTYDEICELCRHVHSFDMKGFVKILVRHEDDELDELAKGNDYKIEYDYEIEYVNEIEFESEDDMEAQEDSEF